MKRFVLLSVLLLMAASPGVSLAATLSVPLPYATIQEALDAATFGDQVLVSPGVYYENIVWPRQSGIRLTGAGAEQSIIDGQGIARTISFPHGDFFTSSTTIEGFTITGGEATGSPNRGGGIWLSYCRATIQDCLIVGNHAAHGGGIHSQGRSTLRRLVFWDNEATVKGGGLLMAGSSNVVDHCSFSFNTADLGPGVYLAEVGETMFSNNIVSGNNGGIAGTEWVIFDPYPPAGPLYIEYNDAPSFPPNAAPVVLGLGNVTSSPQFVDYPGGDLHLESTSPCIDAGSPSAPSDPDGTPSDIGALFFDQSGPTDVPAPGQPALAALEQNRPNPFHNGTRIRFNLPREETVSLSVIGVDGRRIVDLSYGKRSAGAHEVSWDGRDASGAPVPSGIYFYRLQGEDSSQTRRMVVVR